MRGAGKKTWGGGCEGAKERPRKGGGLEEGRRGGGRR